MPPNTNHTEAPPAQIATEEKRIIVGVDFGTSTTKVMYRPLEQDESPHLIDFAHGQRNFPSYAMPSSIRLDGEHRLWFGTFAEVGCGQVFRSIKACAACQAGATVGRGCNRTNSEKGTPPPGCFVDSMFSFIPAYELMIYYLLSLQ